MGDCHVALATRDRGEAESALGVFVSRACYNFDMDQSLTAAEFSSLQALTNEQMTPVIPAEHEDRLKALGLVERLSGGLRLTAAGVIRLKAYQK